MALIDKPETSKPVVHYRTPRGVAFRGFSEQVLVDKEFRRTYRGKVQLVLTSPPFPLNRKKRYGNKVGDQYIQWLSGFASPFRELLTDDGSVVMEIGNAWEPGSPVMSTLALEALLQFMKQGQFRLCQQFICYNPARLPSPAQWVTIDRIRVKDAYTHVWWMSPTDRPNADNRRVLKEYSASMKALLKNQKYNAGARPSEHRIGRSSFLKNNEGAIPPNVLTIANTRSNDPYQLYCRKLGIASHPARMPTALADFFIRFLTEPRNIVLDPFAGSNTTGAAADTLKRRWVAIEPNAEYLNGSIGRFAADEVTVV